MPKVKQLTAEQARTQAMECIELAAVARHGHHRVMLEHIAETWHRIAQEIEDTDGADR